MRAGVRTFPSGHVSPGHAFTERVYNSDTSDHGVSRLLHAVIERRSKECATEVKSQQQERHSAAITSLLQRGRRRRSTAQTESVEGARVAEGLAPCRMRRIATD